MKILDFQKQLKEIDPRLEIRPNLNRTAQDQKCGQGLANIMLDGKDVCPVPSDEIKQEEDPHYYYIFPNGMMGMHTSIDVALARVKHVLNLIKTEEGADVFFDRE